MIWIIGGTSDAVEISSYLSDKGFDIILTTATEYGKSLVNSDIVGVQSGRLSPEDMNSFVDENKFTAIIDASHPFAKDVSSNAILVSESTNIPYLRFERDSLKINAAKYFSSYNSVIEYLKSRIGNIMLTIGSKNAGKFANIGLERTFVRVLSTTSSVEECLHAGFKPDNIFAMKGLFSVNFNAALFEELNIKYVVTKESGTQGGLKQKAEAAEKVGAELLVLERPDIDYRNKTSEITDIVLWLKSIKN